MYARSCVIQANDSSQRRRRLSYRLVSLRWTPCTIYLLSCTSVGTHPDCGSTAGNVDSLYECNVLQRKATKSHIAVTANIITSNRICAQSKILCQARVPGTATYCKAPHHELSIILAKPPSTTVDIAMRITISEHSPGFHSLLWKDLRQ